MRYVIMIHCPECLSAPGESHAPNFDYNGSEEVYNTPFTSEDEAIKAADEMAKTMEDVGCNWVVYEFEGSGAFEKCPSWRDGREIYRTPGEPAAGSPDFEGDDEEGAE